MKYDVVIAGAGVIGAMVARELSQYRLQVCIAEKGSDVCCGASKANSGIIHAGYDPVPGTLKARLNLAGIEKLFQTARMLHVPCQRIGSLVCGFGPEDEQNLEKLYRRGLENGVEQLQLISGEEARQLEPELSADVTMALYAPASGIICPYELTVAAVGNAMDNGADLVTDFEITKIFKEGDLFVLQARDGRTLQAQYVVNCAGGFSDQLSAMVGDTSFHIIPRAGEYLLLDKEEGHRARHTVFQVPTRAGKGILVTPTVDGNLLTGPTAQKVFSPDHTETTSEGLQTVTKLAQKSIPSIAFRQVITSFTGVRASEGNGDFVIRPARTDSHFLNVAAIDSPGLSCCVAIGELAALLLGKMGLKLTRKDDWDGTREDPHLFRKMSDSEKDAYIRRHPAYGKVVCRCETVTEGEIRDAIRRNPPARDIDAVKRRTRAGMGRCQGGFCMPGVMKLLSEELGIPMEQVTKKGKGSEPLTGRL